MRASAWWWLSLVLFSLALVFDDQVGRRLELPPGDAWLPFARWMSRLGEGWVVAVVGLGTSVLLFLAGRLTAARLVSLAAVCGLLTGAAATILRTLVGRTRPNFEGVQGFYGVWHNAHWIVGRYDFGSFPSGHAATVVGLATVVWFSNRKLGVLAGIYAALVCWSRVANGCHHPSDIVGAAVVGVLGAYWCLRILGPRSELAAARLQTAWLKGMRPASRPDLSSET